MYYTVLHNSTKISDLVSFLAERVNSMMRVVLVSTTPDTLVIKLRDAWTSCYAGLMAERDQELDASYIETLTQVITALQRVHIMSAELDVGEEIIIVHPDNIQAKFWENCQIIIACDNQSSMASLNFLAYFSTECKIIAFKDIEYTGLLHLGEGTLMSMARAQKEMKLMLASQASLCESEGFSLGSITSAEHIDIEQLGRIKGKLITQGFIDAFTQNQSRLAELRIVCGRAHHQNTVPESRLHGLKLVTRQLLPQFLSFDHQLYDDPYEIKWRQQKVAV
jgi:hypothetical protein